MGSANNRFSLVDLSFLGAICSFSLASIQKIANLSASGGMGDFLLTCKIMKVPKQAFFQVSLKILLHNGEKFLLTRGVKGDIDLPGGRIDVGEENAPLEDIIAREVREELGKGVKFRLGPVLFMYRADRTKYERWVLGVVFDAEYISGDIKLSSEHMSYEWVDRESYAVPGKDFLSMDQEKYKTFKKYFDSLRTA